MTLIEELIKVLDDDDEPLQKRLKIADNAFTSVELPIHHREIVLLKWLSRLTKDCRFEVWTLFYNWLQSQHFKQLNRSDISQKDVTFLAEVVSNASKNCAQRDVKKLIADVFVAIIENAMFRQYFKFDIEGYCRLVSDVLGNLDDKEALTAILKNENLFHKSYLTADKFSKHFIDVNLPVLSELVDGFNDESVYKEASRILQKCVFQKNSKEFVEYFNRLFENNGEKIQTPTLIKSLRNRYEDRVTFKLVFNSFCATHTNDFSTVYKFTVVLHDILGFDLSETFGFNKTHGDADLEKSLPILSDVFEILARSKTVPDCKLNDTSFSEFIQRVVLTLIDLTGTPDANACKIISSAIAINPLIIEPIVSHVLVYVMMNGRNIPGDYEELLVKIFDVFAKLYRVRKLISKMIQALKGALNGDVNPIENVYAFRCRVNERQRILIEYDVKDILTESILACFSQSVTALGRSRLINQLFKTFLLHFNAVMSEDLQTMVEDHNKIVYFELLSTLLCQFLSSVRIAEHTAHDVAVERFMKKMNELKEILGKFGTTLVTMEHSLAIMRMYLNTCYTWGELYIGLCYYSTSNKITLNKTSSNDYSACNITYVHSYLTMEQWCLISQRITNFGEKPCKKIMHNLFTQRLKCILLFENNINEEITNSYVKDLTLSLDDYWESILQDSFVMNMVLRRMQNAHVLSLADLILKSGNQSTLSSVKVVDEPILANALTLQILSKINLIFRHKNKNESLRCLKLFHEIVDEIFLDLSDEAIPRILDCFYETQSATDVEPLKVNLKKLQDQFEIIKVLPVTFLVKNVQLVLFLYLGSVLSDLNACNSDDDVKHSLENILTGMLASGSFVDCIKPAVVIQFIIANFSSCDGPFDYVFGHIFKRTNDMKQLKGLVGYLAKNLDQTRCLQCTVILMNKMNDVIKQKKLSPENKICINEYIQKMYKSLVKLVSSSDDRSKRTLIFPYAMVLKDCLAKNGDDLPIIRPHLDDYIGYAISGIESKTDVNGGLGLFGTILHNKSKLGIDEDFVMKIWNLCKDIQVTSEQFKDYSKLIVLIFEHVSNEDFPNVMDDLLKTTMQSLTDKNYDRFSEQLKVWSGILTCNFNPVKSQTWQGVLESLMQEMIVVLGNDVSFCGEFVMFEIQMIQTIHVSLPPLVIETLFMTVSTIMSNTHKSFIELFSSSVSILENLLKYRKPLIADRLPSYLQQYRMLLRQLCLKSNSDLLSDVQEVRQLTECAHQLEKLTMNLVKFDRHLARISMYLIADILQQYETITLHPGVKLHVNNCIYSLMSLCDQHATAYLLRVLSTASTEIFKFMYDNYKKYYRFTGKV